MPIARSIFNNRYLWYRVARLCNDSSLHGSALTEFVGREEELELLLRRLTKAKTGEGEVAQYHCDEGIQDIAD